MLTCMEAVNIDKSTSIGGVLTTFEEVVIMVVVVEEVVGAGGIITEQAPSSPRLKMWDAATLSK